MSTDKVVWIDTGWFPAAIGFCPSEKAWNRARRRQNFEHEWPGAKKASAETVYLVNDATGEAMILVCVFDRTPKDAHETLLTLVHEAVHVWQFLCRYIGEEHPGIETEAYSIEAITRGLIGAYCATLGKGRDWL